MELTIIARHCSLSEPARQRARERVERLARYEPRPADVLATFSQENGAKHVEIRVSVRGGHQLVAHGEAADFRAAIDQCAQRLERQLKDHRERHTDHQAEPIARTVIPDEEAVEP